MSSHDEHPLLEFGPTLGAMIIITCCKVTDEVHSSLWQPSLQNHVFGGKRKSLLKSVNFLEPLCPDTQEALLLFSFLSQAICYKDIICLRDGRRLCWYSLHRLHLSRKISTTYQFKNSVYGINLKLTVSSLLCGCNIWSLFLDFPEEEGIFVVLTFTVWWSMRIL